MTPIPLCAASATLHYPAFLSHCLQWAFVQPLADGAPEGICWFAPLLRALRFRAPGSATTAGTALSHTEPPRALNIVLTSKTAHLEIRHSAKTAGSQILVIFLFWVTPCGG